MKLLELHFNPKKENRAFDSFIYEPENIYEKRLGSLYLVGEIENATPKSYHLLNKLAKEIKKDYYKLASKNPDKALNETLKKANELLSEEVKKDNVHWMGNLSFAVLSLKNFKLNFTQTGSIKVVLIRKGIITDITEELGPREIEPYPLKIFFNTVSGKLSENDLILVLTKEIYSFLKEKGIINKIAKLESYQPKEIKKQIPSRLFTKGEGAKVSGVCFAAFLKEEKSSSRKQISAPEKKTSFLHIFKPVLSPLKKTKKSFSKIKPSFKKEEKKKKKEKFVFYSNIASALTAVKKSIRVLRIERNVLLVLFLALILIIGFLLFKGAKESRKIGKEGNIEEIKEKVIEAENFLVFKEKEKAKPLLEKAWSKLSSIETEEAKALKERAEEGLKKVNSFQEIENPETAKADSSIFFEPSPDNLIPPSFEFSFDTSDSYLSNIYFLDKKTCQIVKYSKTGKESWGSPVIWMKDKGPCSNPKSIAIDGSVWILNEDNSLLRCHQGAFQEKIEFDFFPYPEDIRRVETENNFPYLLLLEPSQKRIIMTDKKGGIVKQFYSEKFDNLKDLKLSEDKKAILILNGEKVYQLEI